LSIRGIVDQARKQKSLSYDELGDMCGISGVGIQKIIKGDVKNPSFKNIVSLSVALDLPLDVFMSAYSLDAVMHDDVDRTVGYDEVKRQALQLDAQSQRRLAVDLLNALDLA